jgi:hypothetical protein
MPDIADVALSLRRVTMNNEPESPGAFMSPPTNLVFGGGVHPQGASRKLDMQHILATATPSVEQTLQSDDAICFSETLAMPGRWALTQTGDQLLEMYMDPAQDADADCFFMDSAGECSFSDSYHTWKVTFRPLFWTVLFS